MSNILVDLWDNPEDAIWDAFSLKIDIVEVLKALVKYLNNLNIPYTVICGTLLGLVREHDIITGDSDIDIGLPDYFFKHMNWEYLLHTFQRLFDDKNVVLYRSSCQPFRRCYTLVIGDVHIDFCELIPVKNNEYLWYIPPDMRIQKIINNFIKRKNTKVYMDVKKSNTKIKTLLKMVYWAFTIPRKKFLTGQTFIDCNTKYGTISIPLCYDKWLELTYGGLWMIPHSDWENHPARKRIRRVKRL